MPDRSHLLQGDTTWRALGIGSLEQFERMMPPPFILPGVSVEVCARLEKLHKLMRYSFFDYGLLDVGAEYAMQSFEMALRVRYKEVTGRPPGKKERLATLIRWASAEGLLEDDSRAADALRKARNLLAHSNDSNRFGVIAINLVQRIFDLMNELYDEVEQRRLRHREEQRIARSLDKANTQGAVLRFGGKVIRIFHSRLLHFDNRRDPPEYGFSFWPVFDTRVENDTVETPRPIVFACSGFESAGTSTILRDPKGVIMGELVVNSETEDIETFKGLMKSIAESELPLAYFIDYQARDRITAARRQAPARVVGVT